MSAAAACCRCSHFLCSRDVSYCDIATIAQMAFIGMKDLSTLYVWWLGGVVGGEVGRGDGEGGVRGGGRVVGRDGGRDDGTGGWEG